jgi:hypothetical protein
MKIILKNDYIELERKIDATDSGFGCILSLQLIIIYYSFKFKIIFNSSPLNPAL